MRNGRLVIVLLFVALASVLKAQDPQFSQFNANPLFLNPALTGFFDGDYRIIANYRSQWGSFTNTYRTAAASAELSLFKAQLKDDNFAVGLHFYNDAAGTAAFGTNQLTLSLGYRKQLGRKVKHTLGIGGQFNLIGQRIDTEELIFDNQYNGIEVDPDLLSGENVAGGTGLKPDASIGLLYQIMPNKYVNVYMGAAYAHILQPKISLLSNANYSLEPKYTFHAGGSFQATRSMYFLPSVMYAQQGPSRLANFGTYLQFIMEYRDDGDVAFAIGAWGRISNTTPDAVIVGARLDFVRFMIGLSYDVNVSKLNTVSNSRGAYEISLIYSGLFTTVGKRRLSIPCPQL
jgi:type IX secretion system PorP/SprF family membrane protein